MVKRLLTVTEAANYLGLSSITLYHWINQRKIPFVRLGRKAVRFDRSDLDQMVDRFKVGTVKEAKANGLIQARKDLVAGVLT